MTHTFMALYCWSFLLMARFNMTAEHNADMLLCLGPFILGGAFEVAVVEEQGEKDQVAEVHDRAPQDVVHVGWTAHLVHPVVHQAQDGQAHRHLQDLGGRDDHGKGAGHPQASRSGRVVCVHERMNHVVHGHEPAAARHLVLVGVPRVEQHSDVMVPVQEDEALLPEDDEHCVTWKGRGQEVTYKDSIIIIICFHKYNGGK